MRRLLKWTAIVLIAILLPFGALMVGIPLAIAHTIAKIDPNWKPAPKVIFWAWVWAIIYRVPFKFALSLLYNEAASTPRNLRASELNALGMDSATGYPVGDIGNRKGPAIGAGQVLRENIERLWSDVRAPLSWVVIATRPEDLALVGNERQALWASVKVMREELDTANGDEYDAARAYNGGAGSTDPRALAYARKSQDSIERMS